MLKTILLSAFSVALLSLTAVAQDTPHTHDAPEDGPVVVEKKAVVVMEEQDGDGPPQVIILEGDDLDGFDLDLDLDMHGDGVHKRVGKFKMRDGNETMEFDLDLSGDGNGDVEKHLKAVRKKLKGLKGMEGMQDLLDPEKRGAFIERMKTRAKARRKQSSEAKAKREREDAIKSLKLEDEVAAVVVPLLDAVLETQRRVAREDTARRKGLRKGAQDDEALRPKLDALRAASKKDAQDLGAARAELRQILTLEQEIELVLRGILD